MFLSPLDVTIIPGGRWLVQGYLITNGSSSGGVTFISHHLNHIIEVGRSLLVATAELYQHLHQGGAMAGD